MNDILQRDHRSIRGTIRYTSKKPERLDQERGREYFMMNVHRDGSRTCIAHCEIDDRPSVMRDITYSLDADWYPTDCFVRLAVDDRFMGSGWFRFGPDYAECETYTSLDGRVTQRMDTDGRLKTFQNHAIVCDAWHMRLFRSFEGTRGAEHSRDAAFIAGSPRCHGTDAVPDRVRRRVRRRREHRGRGGPIRMRCISVSCPRPACPRPIRPMTSGAPTMTTSSSSRATSAATCRPITNSWN